MISRRLEVWGGIEATVNRVGDTFFDQIELSGHCTRLEDLDLMAGLGITAMRYPVLWERVYPDGADRPRWEWTDIRLARLRELGIRPIVTLLHHGSGPAHTNLLHPEFATGLADFARQVAERYPWLDAYTPVNEPLTTARFSCLYGHWYPHTRSLRDFYRALYNEMRGSQLAMQAVRQVNPQAQYIQTEDLGKTYGSPLLGIQTDYENTRRWLSLDFAAGRVDPQHAFWRDLVRTGLQPAELEQLCEAPAAPDIFGLNYYVTSERFLDERLVHYPQHLHGGNGWQRYADVEAARICTESIAGAGALLMEAWQRYGLPLALTEVHLGGTREEQLRWLSEVWLDAQAAQQQGADVRAITVWAMLGSYNWHCLVTRDDGHYESGVFDLRASTPRPTVLAKATRSLALTGEYTHPVLDTAGWWHRPDRILYPMLSRSDETTSPGAIARPALRARQTVLKERPILIVGKRGTLAGAFRRICERRGLAWRALSSQEVDITRPESVEEALASLQPWAVINTAGYVRVDEAELEPEACFRLNTTGVLNLVNACASASLPLITFSSDLVFDGQQNRPYLEDHSPSPLNVYGRSKAEAERQVLERHPQSLVVRTSAFFGPWDEYNFAMQVVRAAQQQEPFAALSDVSVSPTYVPDLVNACLDLLVDGESGLWHLANQGEVTWLQFAQMVATAAGVSQADILPRTLEEMHWKAARPRYSVLSSRRSLLLPPLDEAIAKFCRTPGSLLQRGPR